MDPMHGCINGPQCPSHTISTMVSPMAGHLLGIHTQYIIYKLRIRICVTVHVVHSVRPIPSVPVSSGIQWTFPRAPQYIYIIDTYTYMCKCSPVSVPSYQYHSTSVIWYPIDTSYGSIHHSTYMYMYIIETYMSTCTTVNG
jgi:hypothetical protein